MNLFRLLVLGAIAWLVYRFVSRWKVTIEPRDTPQNPDSQALVRCTHCGVRVPAATLGNDGRCRQCRSTAG